MNKADSNETEFNVALNFTGMMGGNMSAIVPDCYKFGKSIVNKETARWIAFDSNWGNFFLAFLFNQMGNALNFQQRIVNIQLYEETQNFQSYYTEIGAIIHLVWDFQPLLTVGAKQAIDVSQLYQMVDNFASTLFPDSPVEQQLLKSGLSKAVAFFAEYARDENDSADGELEPPVSELIRHTRLNNSTDPDDPRVE